MTRTGLALIVLALAGSGRAGAQARPRAQESLDQSRRTAIVTSAARVSPAVVSVGVVGRRRVQQSPFDMFFAPEGNEQQVQNFGTGFVVRADGVIITNQHVVDGAERITVTLADGSDVPATLVGEDATTDIAVLRVNRVGLPVAPLGSSDDLMIGEWVVALGNPYRFLLSNVEPTVTAGVISAVGRNILPTGDQPGLYLDMIQTDAAINPGNSGGPLANALGQVIGVNASIFSSSGGSIGLGFAIPIERAMRVTGEILRQGEMHRAWTGIDVAGTRQMQLTRSPDGLRIDAVATGSPAAIAGLRAGDLMLLANGHRMRTWLDWEAVKLDVAVGDTVLVEVKGPNGSAVRRRIRTGELPSVTAEKVPALQDIQLVTVTPAIRAERRIAAQQGALIFSISADAARYTGLQSGDVILAINNSRVEDAAAVGTTIERLRPTRGFRIFFERDRRIRFTDLSLSS
jgi:serine protease Do